MKLLEHILTVTGRNTRDVHTKAVKKYTRHRPDLEILLKQSLLKPLYEIIKTPYGTVRTKITT